MRNPVHRQRENQKSAKNQKYTLVLLPLLLLLAVVLTLYLWVSEGKGVSAAVAAEAAKKNPTAKKGNRDPSNQTTQKRNHTGVSYHVAPSIPRIMNLRQLEPISKCIAGLPV